MGAKGWTHPQHWKMAVIALVMQIGSTVFYGVASAVPFFTDRQATPPVLLKAIDMAVVCYEEYCYQPAKSDTSEGKSWYTISLIMVAVGGISGLLSLVLQLLVFWPVVLCAKRVLNIVLLLARIVDFSGAPLKFLGVFWMLWYVPHINHSHSWSTHPGALQFDPLPLGLILFSYILQTLSFVAATLAMDKGAKGFASHLEIIKQKNLTESLEAAVEEEFQRVSYSHPMGKNRSSKLLSDVAEHFPSTVLKITESNV